MNTKINYLYRDADNYKMHNECVIAGSISEEQKAIILESLDAGEYFIPHKVGLPERRFDYFGPEVDYPWFELNEYSFEETVEAPTVEITASELVQAFSLFQEESWESGNCSVDVLIDEAIRKHEQQSSADPTHHPEKGGER